MNKLKLEFNKKITDSVKTWYNQTKNKKTKYGIFGIFDNYVMTPTPYYYTHIFYNTIRDELISEVIENT